jgi:glycosyltransferase involved in cell wall biosynthesis
MLNFVRVGPPLESAIRDSLMKQCPKVNIQELRNLSEEQLAAVYQKSDVLFFPSILEGFGFPVVEAMAAGTPVVASNASSIPEVGGEAALYFDPTDAGAAAGLLVRVLTDTDLAERLRNKGRLQALELDWKQHFSQLTGHYRRLVSVVC